MGRHEEHWLERILWKNIYQFIGIRDIGKGSNEIALRNEETGGYGGILIRSVFDSKTNKLYKGRMVCAMILFSGTSAFESTIPTSIIQYTFEKKDINLNARIGIGQNGEVNGADKHAYQFFIAPISK
ncbi:hypothetical protein SYJ56_13835 [Algoriphagus sp. D3-2-R+10]|uniref:hypothetical protein n=1 Tax=Algoriphagus aurantiacus TaxID=3103948 RepID=UPI002B3DC05A|nr:hypothetical protein [Algoriphagus sp. D3-2-R+10]MEB2776398.1 hypothetical protein [Algoriphagus sp. D3-2-R+10]